MTKQAVNSSASLAWQHPSMPTSIAASVKVDGRQIFDRVGSLVDLALMQKSTAVIFGLGSGGHQLARTLATHGVGNFALADGDTLDAANVGTTMIELTDCGLAKVDVARRAIHAINPEVRIDSFRNRDCDLSEELYARVVTEADLVLQLTDSPAAAYRLNAAGLRFNRDVVHAGTHPGNGSFEVIGTLRDAQERCGCYRCFARARSEAFASSQIPESESFPASRASAEMRNAVVTYVALGLLHYRAGSPLPISAWGKAFAALPCWVGRLTPGGFGAPGQLFADAPDDVFFGVRPYREQLPPGWTCPACGTRGE